MQKIIVYTDMAQLDDGSMRKDKREESLQQIRENKSTKIILISFKAGSTGLNLTSCNNVILVDMWWNPALEASFHIFYRTSADTRHRTKLLTERIASVRHVMSIFTS